MTAAKPPTARTVKRVIAAYEPTYNQIAALCRALAESEDAGFQYLRDDIDRGAHYLFSRLHDLHDDMTSREKGR